MSAAHDASAVLADLVACLAAIGRSLDDAFDPRKFLGEFSAELQRLIPHDRLVIACLTDDRRTFTVFAQHAANGPVPARRCSWLYSGGQVIGGLVASSLTPGIYSAAHAATGRQVADLIAPFVQNCWRPSSSRGSTRSRS
jgi:hypothetical protein